jgi:tetratricopeptide (TPR) repeat protein
MVKNKLLFFIILVFGITTNAQKVSNITFKQEQSNIIVSYDLETKTTCKIDLFVSTNGGTTWQGPLKKVLGDVGAKVITGKRSIVWNVLEEFNELSGSNIKFQVRAEEPKIQSIAAINNAILKNPKDAKLFKLRGDLKFENWKKDSDFSIENAQADYNKAIFLNPKYAEAYKSLSTTYISPKEKFKAISYLDKAISLSPKDSEAFYMRSSIYEDMFNFSDENKNKIYFEQSLKDINNAVELNPNNIEYLLFKGRLKALVNDVTCIEDFNKILKLDSINPVALKKRGIAKFRLLNNVESVKSDFDNYFKLYTNFIKEDDSYDIIYPARFYFNQMKNYTLTIDYSNKVLEVCSKYDIHKDSTNYIFQDALLYRAVSKNKLNDFMSSESDFDILITNSKDKIKTIKEICNFFLELSIEDGRKEFFEFLLVLINKKVKAEPWNTENYLMLVEIHENLEKYSAAILDISQVIKYEPNKENYKKRAKLKIDIEDYKGAISDYSYAIEQYNNSNNSDLFHNRAVAKDELKDYSGAIADYSKAIDLEPKDADNYIDRARSKNNIKDYIGAISDINKALEINPNLDYLYYRRAYNKFDLGDYRGAILDYSKYIIKNPEEANNYYFRGNAKYNISDFKGAIADYTKAISLDPKYAEAYLWRGNAKIEIKDKIGACKDFSKAGELELKEAYDAINKNCN